MLSRRKMWKSNRLLQECIQALNTVSVLESEELIRQLFLKFHEKFANDTYSQIECKLEVLAGKDYYIMWDNAELPIIKCKGKDILMCVEDVLAVSFDTYIVSEDFSECFHSDDVGKVWKYDEVLKRNFEMILPFGVTEEIYKKCKDIVSELTGEQDAEEVAISILQIIDSKGGGYSEKIIRAFAEDYTKTD